MIQFWYVLILFDFCFTFDDDDDDAEGGYLAGGSCGVAGTAALSWNTAGQTSLESKYQFFCFFLILLIIYTSGLAKNTEMLKNVTHFFVVV